MMRGARDVAGGDLNGSPRIVTDAETLNPILAVWRSHRSHASNSFFRKWDVWLDEADAFIGDVKEVLVHVDGDWKMQARPPKSAKPKQPKPQSEQFDLF